MIRNPFPIFPISKHCLAGVLSLSFCLPALAQDAAKQEKTEDEAPKAAEPAKAEAEAPKLSDEEVKTAASYALGHRTGADFARNFGQFGVKMSDLERESFMKGFADAFGGEELGVPEITLATAMAEFGKAIEKREKELAEENLEKGKAFLAENKKREEVVTTDSGLQYEVLQKGGDEVYQAPKEGEPPVQKIFNVHYRGTLIDGTEFDASPEGETIPMTLQVVPGFREALTTMPVGAKWKLYLAPDLAYGEQRASPDIGPNSTLIFELELESIEDAPQRQGMPFQMPPGR
ncbi:MAG: FKBP-type peptidyl-prolyl cis-trans isomerase [Akkermansiaceae bacterium]|nr:FKBP-type peptidyl-prolyl cis-trans isomerase [Akkermansiaceae bacterium]